METLRPPPLVVVRIGGIYEVRDGTQVLTWAEDAAAAAAEARAHAQRFRRSGILYLEDGRLERLEPDG